MKHDGLLTRVIRLVRPPITATALEPWGRALEDHFRTGNPKKFYVHDSNGLCMAHTTAENFSVTKRCRSIHETALKLCHGRVLDAGAGVGRDALELKGSGLEVLPIDVEPRCVEIMHARGLASAICIDIRDLEESKFDTILVMQMTIGLAGNLEGLVHLLGRLAQLMRAGGQILLDSMSPAYLAGSPYYAGQRQIALHYGRYIGPPIPWLYVDYDVLRTCAKHASLETELVDRGSVSHDYLARLFKRNQ